MVQPLDNLIYYKLDMLYVPETYTGKHEVGKCSFF